MKRLKIINIFICVLAVLFVFNISTSAATKNFVAGPNNTNQAFSGIKTKVCILGDSISDHAQYNAGEKLYMDYIAMENEIEVINFAARGAGFKSCAIDPIVKKYSVIPYYLKIDDMPKDTDILLIFSSFNDVYFKETMPYSYGKISDMDISTLYGAMNITLAKAKAINPNVTIGVVTPMHWMMLDQNSVSKKDCDEYVTVVKTWANHNKIPILDLYADFINKDIDFTDRNNYQQRDGTHISAHVHREYLLPRIKDFLTELQNNKAKKSDIKTKDIYLSTKYEFADFSKIHSGRAKLYTNNTNEKGKRVVCLNAGHGTKNGTSLSTYSHPDKTGKYSGGTTKYGEVYSPCVSVGTTFKDGVPEADATLQIALNVRDVLLELGYSVLMIREESDVQLDNVARAVIANNNANIHISFHFDGTKEDKGIFYIAAALDDRYLSMYPVSKTHVKSEKLGDSIINSLSLMGEKIYLNGKQYLDLTQISYSTIPSIDLELGDQASAHDIQRLNELSVKIAAAIDGYFENNK